MYTSGSLPGPMLVFPFQPSGRARMPRQFLPVSRRRLLQSTAAGAAATMAGALSSPAVLRAHAAPVKIGLLHSVSGALSYSGQQGPIGATMAIDEINSAGGVQTRRRAAN